MKRILALLLCIATLLTFAACGNTGGQPIETTEEAKPVDNFPYPTINDKLTWEKINSFPIKTQDMTVQKMREACVDFMRFSKTAMWIPNAQITFVKNKQGAEDQLQKGQIYAGFPYLQYSTGNVYRLMDYMNEETGVVDVTEFSKQPRLIGNQCASSTNFAWGRVINSATATYTVNMTHANGYLRIGPYTYDDKQVTFAQNTTKMICEQNGLDVMCESYAQLHPADGVVNYITSGHVRMVAAEPHVEYYNGKIDPVRSYIIILDQGQSWQEYTNEAGDKAQMKANVDKKLTFMDLYADSYIPFSFAEFLGTKGVDKTECSVNLSGDSVEPAQLFNAEVTANFGISDVYVSLKNQDGKEVYRLAVRATASNNKTLKITRNGTNAATWGDYDKLSGEYTAEVSAQLSTGERPVIYTGKVTINN